MAIINGRCYDWNSVTLGISGCENVEPTEISYDAERDEEVIYGKGGDPRGYGTGNRKNSVKMSMLREDFDEICNVMQKKESSHSLTIYLKRLRFHMEMMDRRWSLIR